jgi:GABA permease
VWQRFEVVDRAAELGLPVTHVEAASLVAQV